MPLSGSQEMSSGGPLALRLLRPGGKVDTSILNLLKHLLRICGFVGLAILVYTPFDGNWINHPSGGWDDGKTSDSWDTFKWDWDWIDCMYFAMATMTTVGYGDMPTLRQEIRIFTMFFGAIGVVFIAGSITVIADWFTEQTRKRFIASQRVILLDAHRAAEAVRRQQVSPLQKPTSSRFSRSQASAPGPAPEWQNSPRVPQGEPGGTGPSPPPSPPPRPVSAAGSSMAAANANANANAAEKSAACEPLAAPLAATSASSASRGRDVSPPPPPLPTSSPLAAYRVRALQAAPQYAPQLLHADPWLVQLDNLLSRAEAQALLDKCRGRWHAAQTRSARGAASGSRNSSFCWCGHDGPGHLGCRYSPLGRRLLARLAAISGVAPERAESPQLLRYGPGEHYSTLTLTLTLTLTTDPNPNSNPDPDPDPNPNLNPNQASTTARTTTRRTGATPAPAREGACLPCSSTLRRTRRAAPPTSLTSASPSSRDSAGGCSGQTARRTCARWKTARCTPRSPCAPASSTP